MLQQITATLIAADAAGTDTPDYPELADAVLAAMEEPTEEMLIAGYDLGPGATLRERWRAMISAARQDRP